MAVSEKPWGPITAADYPDAGAYCDACLINENTGPREQWTKGACHLPVREPGGALNRAGCHGDAAVLAGARGGVDVPAAAKRSAARKLLAIYRNDLKETPPPSLMHMAM